MKERKIAMDENKTQVVVCTETYVEDNIEYWTKGRIYDAVKSEDGEWSIKTNIDTIGKVGPGYMIEDFYDQFDDEQNLVEFAKFCDATGIKLEDVQLELNRAWIYNKENEDGEPIGETNFVVPEVWCRQLFKNNREEINKLGMHASNYEDFIEIYEPETQGEYMYQKAKEDGVLIEESAVNYY